LEEKKKNGSYNIGHDLACQLLGITKLLDEALHPPDTFSDCRPTIHYKIANLEVAPPDFTITNMVWLNSPLTKALNRYLCAKLKTKPAGKAEHGFKPVGLGTCGQVLACPKAQTCIHRFWRVGNPNLWV